MTFLKYSLVLLALSLSTISCSSLFDNSNPGISNLDLHTEQVEGNSTEFNGDTLIFQPVEPEDSYPDSLPDFISEAKKESIHIEGYFMSPCSNWKPTGDINHEKSSLDITIYPEKSDNCATMPAGYTYKIKVSNLSSDSYDLSIIHKNDALRDEESALVFRKDFTLN